MKTENLVEQLIAQGVYLSLRGDELLAVAPPDLIDEIRKHKSELVYRLQRLEELRRTESRPPRTDEELTLFFRELNKNADAWRIFETEMEEAAAIMEFDGGLSREAADVAAEEATALRWLEDERLKVRSRARSLVHAEI
jgi:hypothetical protein